MLINYESQQRWCGRCGQAVLPVQQYVNWYGEKVIAPGRALCPECHHDTRGGPHNPGAISHVRAREDSRRI